MKKILKIILFLVLSSIDVCAQSCGWISIAMFDLMRYLRDIGYPIAIFMMIYMGIKWMTSENPESRENARKGVIYVIIGILMLRVGHILTYDLLCF